MSYLGQLWSDWATANCIGISAKFRFRWYIETCMERKLKILPYTNGIHTKSLTAQSILIGLKNRLSHWNQREISVLMVYRSMWSFFHDLMSCEDPDVRVLMWWSCEIKQNHVTLQINKSRTIFFKARKPSFHPPWRSLNFCSALDTYSTASLWPTKAVW